MMKKILWAALLLGLLASCSPGGADAPSSSAVSAAPSAPQQTSSAPVPPSYPMHITPGEETFTAGALPQDVIERVTGVSWVENDQVPLSSLSLVTVSYLGFDGESYTGQMIAAADVAAELCDIFRELYEARFPIEKIRLIDDYGADDNAAMADNNSSAFCYRPIDGTDVLSNHSFGRAVDINPVQNPYVRGDLVQPEQSRDYLDREQARPGMITRGDACYNAFTARGWSWGGDWTGPIDYQHFEKL